MNNLVVDTNYSVKTEKSKQVKSVVKQLVSEETGEIINLETEKHFTTKIKSGEFFMFFLENMAPFYGIKQLADVKLLVALCEHATFNQGVVQLSSKVRKMLASKAGVSLTNVSKNFKRLRDLGLITEDDGEITINPAVFWKGTLQERIDIIRSEGVTFKITLIEG